MVKRVFGWCQHQQDGQDYATESDEEDADVKVAKMRRDSSAAGAVCSSASCPSATSSCASSIARGILLAPPQDWKDGRKYKQGQAQGVFAASGHGASSGSIPSVGTVLQPGNFRLHSLLGKGGFGKVYSAVVLSQPHSAAATSTKSMHVAVKVARTQGTKCEEALKMLRKEAQTLELLQRHGIQCVPALVLFHDEGTGRQEGLGPSFLATTLLHTSLDALGQKLRADADESEVFLLSREAGVAIANALECVHGLSVLHNDISPDNVMTKVNCPGDSSCASSDHIRSLSFFLIDFGLSSLASQRPPGPVIASSRDLQSKRLMPAVAPAWMHVEDTIEADQRAGDAGVDQYDGTPDFVSARIMRGADPRPIDDIWAAFHTLVHFVTGSLPWLRCEDDLEILRKKDAVSAEELCRFCPEQFKPILAYLKRFSYWAANDDALEVDYGLIANEFKKQGPTDMRSVVVSRIIDDVIDGHFVEEDNRWKLKPLQIFMPYGSAEQIP